MSPVRLGLPLLFFGCLLALAVHRLFGYDLWWQLATGAWIMENGLPSTDPFSYAFPDRPWIEPRWLYCVAVNGPPFSSTN